MNIINVVKLVKNVLLCCPGWYIQGCATVEVFGVVAFCAIVASELHHELTRLVNPVPLVSRSQLLADVGVVQKSLESATSNKVNVGRERSVRYWVIHFRN